LEFNVTHSAGIVAIMISGAQPVGVDLERTRAVDDFSTLAERYFAEREVQAMHDAADTERLSLFFDLWTAKEAVVKGVGSGLSMDLQSFETSPTPGRLTPVENCGADPHLNGWFVYALPRADETLHVAMALRGYPDDPRTGCSGDSVAAKGAIHSHNNLQSDGRTRDPRLGDAGQHSAPPLARLVPHGRSGVESHAGDGSNARPPAHSRSSRASSRMAMPLIASLVGCVVGPARALA
jgi:hypothetical protein